MAPKFSTRIGPTVRALAFYCETVWYPAAPVHGSPLVASISAIATHPTFLGHKDLISVDTGQLAVPSAYIERLAYPKRNDA